MDSSEDEMNVYLKVIKTVAFKVKRSETTKKLKALFTEKEGTPENLQELFFTGKQLKDDHKLVDYGIGTNSTLDLYLQAIDRIKILVYLPSNEKTLELDAKSHETVKNIKILIQTEEGIPPEQFTLFYGGELLEDDRTLASLRIQSASMLYLVPNPRDVVSVSVRMQSGDILKLKVKVLHTVQDLKAIVQSMVGFVAGGKDLTYEGKLLEDSKTLASCNIKENSLLEMLPLTIKIYVTSVKRKTLLLRVFKENKVKVLDVKNMISDLKGVPVENIRLISDPDDDREKNSRKMENDQELAFYNVGENSELTWIDI